MITLANKLNPKSQIPLISKELQGAERLVRFPKSQILNPKFQKFIKQTKANYQKALEEFKFNEALSVVWELIGLCDKYIDKEKPWENKNQILNRNKFLASESKNQKVISDLLVSLENIAQLLKPFLPETSRKILDQLKTQKSEPLFPRLK